MSAIAPMSLPRMALAIRHVHFEDCGLLTDVLLDRNFGIRYLDVGRHDLAEIDVDSADLVIGLGGPVSVYSESYPWIRDELRLFERCLALRKPLIGICLGSQMLARALGSRVYPGPAKELGWKALTLTEAGRKSVVAPLVHDGTSMLHWHGDTFDLPRGAELLASTDLVANQIFAWQRHAIGFQCHLEIGAHDIERWLIGHACEIEATAGVTVEQIRADTARLAPALNRQARTVFNDWLERAGL